MAKIIPGLEIPTTNHSALSASQNPNMIELEQFSLNTLKIVAENIPSNGYPRNFEVWENYLVEYWYVQKECIWQK